MFPVEGSRESVPSEYIRHTQRKKSGVRKSRQFLQWHSRICFFIHFFHELLFHELQCRVSPRATSLWAKQDWYLMRTTLTGSLSQPCHPALTLLIPHVAQGALHNAKRTIDGYLPALVHIFTHTHINKHVSIRLQNALDASISRGKRSSM